jgi:myxalamid-type polyketide synthase MxaB
MAMELVNVLEARLDINLPVALLMEGPSVASLAEHAADLIVPGASGQADTSGADKPGSAAAWSPLVLLRSGEDRPPLFCIHALDGDPRCYHELAGSVGNEWPVYAMRSRGADGSVEPHHAMEEMVADYLEAVRTVQPAGPYFLVGWSAGGIYAYEMTRRLMEQGDQVALLVFLDTPLPSIYDNVDLNDDVRFLADFVNFVNGFLGVQMDCSYEQLREHDSETAFQIALEEAKRHNVLPTDGSTDHIRRLIEVARTNARMIMDYSLSPIDQHVHLVQPVERHVLAEAAGESLGADLGWQGVLGHQLTLEEAPGDHFTMLTGSNAVRLGELLTLRLEEAHAYTSGPSDHPAPKQDAAAHSGETL